MFGIFGKITNQNINRPKIDIPVFYSEHRGNDSIDLNSLKGNVSYSAPKNYKIEK